MTASRRFGGWLAFSLLLHGGALYSIGVFDADTAGGRPSGLRVSLDGYAPAREADDAAYPDASSDSLPAETQPDPLEPVAPGRGAAPVVITTRAAAERSAVAAPLPEPAIATVPLPSAVAEIEKPATTEPKPQSLLASLPAEKQASHPAPERVETEPSPTTLGSDAQASDLADSLQAGNGGAGRESASVGEQLLAALQDHFSYPLRARRKGWEGDVLLGVDVDEQGVIGEVRLLASSGYGSLDRAAIASMRAVGALQHALVGRLTVEVPVRYRLIN